MKVSYIDLIRQTFDFPQKEFSVEKGDLLFHGFRVMDLVEQYNTPLKFYYLPKISENIRLAKAWFANAMAQHDYNGTYKYCYCTKSSHFSFVLKEVLKNEVNIETSFATDLDIVRKAYDAGNFPKDRLIVCNGFKTDLYLDKIVALIEDGFNIIPVLDNKRELQQLLARTNKKIQLGIRIASEEEPKFEFYTSRLGIGYKDILPFYKKEIAKNSRLELRMLHFFINTGIRDNAYYWNELIKCLKVYTDLKKVCKSLDMFNIGGGFPIKNSLGFEYDYTYMIEEIVGQIKKSCQNENVQEPHILTEFGSFTVGESGGAAFKILHQKQQNDREKWNMIDSSFMTNLPDTWALSKRFILLPLNRWNDPYERVFLGGLTCDSDDYYNSEQHINAIYLPKYDPKKPLYIGFFNMGAYQESLGGFSGYQHCLIPNPRMITIQKNKEGKISSKTFSEAQTGEKLLKILGY